MSDLTNKPFFDEESVRRAFELPDWPAATEIVVYCRRSDSHETIEAVAERAGWKIDRYVYIDDSPVASFYKQGQVMLAKREAVDWDFKPAPLSDNVIELPRHIKEQMRCNYQTWVNQMLGMPGKKENNNIKE